MEVSLPQCRYRADVAAYRPMPNERGCTAIFECKQARPDLRRDNCCSAAVTRRRLETRAAAPCQVMEKHLRIHYPTLRGGESLFPELDSHDFAAIGHRGYTRVLRELSCTAKSAARWNEVREAGAISLRQPLLSRFA